MKTQTITLALLLITLSFTSCKKDEKPTSETSIKKVDTTKQYQKTKAKISENGENETYEKKENSEVSERKENREEGEKNENR